MNDFVDEVVMGAVVGVGASAGASASAAHIHVSSDGWVQGTKSGELRTRCIYCILVLLFCFKLR